MTRKVLLSAMALSMLVIPTSMAADARTKRFTPDTRMLHIKESDPARFIGAVTGRMVLVCNISESKVGRVDEITQDDEQGNSKVEIAFGSCATLDGDKKPRVAPGPSNDAWTALLITYFKDGKS